MSSEQDGGTSGSPWEEVRASDLPLDLERADLSDWFNPFLVPLAGETLRCGGRASVARRAGATVALRLLDSAERVATVFSRSAELVRGVVDDGEHRGVFTEVALDRRSERYDLFVSRLPRGGRVQLVHPVRPLAPADHLSVLRLLREVYGTASATWLDGATDDGEVGLVAGPLGEVHAAAWLRVVGGRARLHSLTVRADHRRAGIGLDLLHARLWYAELAGAREAFSEIAESNAASRGVAAKAGMSPEGAIYLYGRGRADAATAPASLAPGPTSGSPRRTDSSAP